MLVLVDVEVVVDVGLVVEAELELVVVDAVVLDVVVVVIVGVVEAPFLFRISFLTSCPAVVRSEDGFQPPFDETPGFNAADDSALSSTAQTTQLIKLLSKNESQVPNSEVST